MTSERKYKNHRAVFEAAYGPIPEGCVVHHRNGRTDDNRLGNLELMTFKQHAVHHNQKHPTTKECSICGKTFTPHRTKRVRARTCSQGCRLELQRRAAAERYAINTERDEEIRRLVADGAMKKDVADVFGLAKSTITRITK